MGRIRQVDSVRILVVEDNDVNASQVRHTLLALGHSVVGTATSGAQALALAYETRPELVIMDVMLEGDLDGVETALQIRRQSDAAIVFLSARSDGELVRRAVDAQADGYLVKPCDRENLRVSLQVALGRRRAAAGRSLPALVESERHLRKVMASLDAAGRARVLRERQQAAVARLGELALGSEDLQRLLEQAVTLVGDTLETDGASILELLSEGESVKLRAARHRALDPEHPIVVPLSGGPAGWVLRNLNPDISNDLRRETRYRVDPELLDQGAVSCVTVPIPGADRPFGVLGAWTKSPRIFTDTDVHVLEAFASLLALVARRRRTEDALRQKELELRQAQKMEAIGTLAGGVAHDFNNLLSAISGFSEILLSDMDPADPRREFAEQIRDAGDRAAVLTRQLLAFSRKQLVSPRVFDLNGVVVGVDKMLRRLIGEHIQLELRLAARLYRVKADLGQIEQVIVNLAVNARDAMPEGGVLCLETSDVVGPGGEFVRLRVCDTGCGIDPDVIDHVFEPFFTTKGPGQGTGLGLSTVYGIVAQAGGSVAVSSRLGEGSRFDVFLPAASEEMPSGSLRQQPARIRGGSETVLVVEDDERVRNYVTLVLERNGYQVLSASDGMRAASLCRDHAGGIDLLLTDTVMPGWSGSEVARRVAELRPDIKVLYMSGYTDDEVARHGVMTEGVPFIAKPFRPDRLGRKIREVLDEEEPS